MRLNQRFSFSLSGLLAVAFVAAALISLNVRPSYPNWPDRSSPLTGGVALTTMRQYGWPFACVDAYRTHGRGEITREYRITEVRWRPVVWNVIFLVFACSSLAWICGRLTEVAIRD